ncbi:multi-sensor signal transduction histidine kinase [Candidatus Omnitrophus magneticus]|uniref:histidine kinase n=1 Tax=Candidatus Omnitrophus magneticus TaxID=1609969 RepID=A0A0F0CU58_9BACT|nr:multi-sensor signal transduction histidine kinase [Candidatus Omnitrophus magneticus]
MSFYLYGNLSKSAYENIKINLLKNLNLASLFVEVFYSVESQKINSIKNIEITNTAILGRITSFDALADKIGETSGARATIIDIDGTVLGDSLLTIDQIMRVENHLYRTEVQSAIHTGFGESKRFSTTIKKHMLYKAKLVTGKNFFGIIRLAKPLIEIEGLENDIKKIIIPAGSLGILLAILLSFLAALFLTKSLREISNLAKDFVKGDFTTKFFMPQKDETAHLAKAFNLMGDEIKVKIKDITMERSRLEAIFLSMFDGVMVFDEQGRITLMNSALTSVLNITESYEGKLPIEIIRNIEIRELSDKILSFKEGVISQEIIIHNVQEKVLLIHATPLVMENVIKGGVMVFHDITNLRKLEQIRKDFVANVSHELKTPVASIKGYAETLIDGALNDEKNARSFLNVILKESDRLNKLIDNILELSKLESGKNKIKFIAVDMRNIAEQVINAIRQQSEQKNISVTLNSSPAVYCKAKGDEQALYSALFNLVDNAVKYTERNGFVSIFISKIEGFIKVSVIDTGCGIPEELLSRVFERFFRVDKSHSRKIEGTGLGLSIVKNIIQAHGGSVMVKSVVGEGSDFSFIIPKV